MSRSAPELLRAVRIDATSKGMPSVSAPVPLLEVGAQGWSLDDLRPPFAVLRRSALEHNVSLMAAYCDEHGVSIAPHGKTTMAPQLWSRQLEAGAWGISAATAAQAAVMRAAGVPRILIANPLTDAAAIGWAADDLRDEANELACYVDSERGVELLEGVLHEEAPPRQARSVPDPLAAPAREPLPSHLEIPVCVRLPSFQRGGKKLALGIPASCCKVAVETGSK